MLCYHGCGNEANFHSKWTKRSRCEFHVSKCPAVRMKNSAVHLISEKNRSTPGSFTGKSHSEETKLRISDSMKGNRNANHRGDRQTFYNGIRMDSSWERGVAEYFDANDINWKYSERGFTLSSGSIYYPDFFIYEDDIFIKLVEVKGYFRESNKQKFEMFLSEFPEIDIELWQRDKLRQLNIIDHSGYIVKRDEL